MGTGICPFCGKKVDKFIMFRGDVVGCRYCGIHTKQTNADHIRSMSDEELAEWIETIANCDSCQDSWSFGKCRGGDGTSHATCRLKWLDWLKQEAVSNG